VTAQAPDLDVPRLLAALLDHDVAFVLIGGMAGVAHGSPSVTRDLDVCYDRSAQNLAALAAALASLHARLRGVPDDLPFRLDARTLRNGDSFTFVTDAGDLDCLGTPSGTTGYADLIKNATEMEIAGRTIKIAALDDLIRMKRAAGRPKDRAELEILGALREEIDARPPYNRRRHDDAT
jgi:hypothetical protein